LLRTRPRHSMSLSYRSAVNSMDSGDCQGSWSGATVRQDYATTTSTIMMSCPRTNARGINTLFIPRTFRRDSLSLVASQSCRLTLQYNKCPRPLHSNMNTYSNHSGWALTFGTANWALYQGLFTKYNKPSIKTCVPASYPLYGTDVLSN